MDVIIHIKSFRKGIQAMPDQFNFFKPKYWSFHFHNSNYRFIHAWTPSWHKGRGPYFLFVFKPFRIFRGY